jgi:DNA-binding NarL/FixJ family response regulator
MSEENQNPDTVTVMLVDDHAIWRGGVRSMLDDTEFQVIAEASSGREAVTVAAEAKPQLILLDIRMAGGDGLEALLALKQILPDTIVVMLTTYDNPTFMARAVAGGAAGYLMKGVDEEEMLGSLRSVVAGDALISRRDLVRSLKGLSVNSPGERDLIEPLTDREQEVIKLVATGMSNKDIAQVLYVAESTVKTHVEHIIGKIGVSDRVQAAVWAVRHGIASEETSR